MEDEDLDVLEEALREYAEPELWKVMTLSGGGVANVYLGDAPQESAKRALQRIRLLRLERIHA